MQILAVFNYWVYTVFDKIDELDDQLLSLLGVQRAAQYAELFVL